MSIKSAPFYWLECDGCGVKSTEGSEHAAWAEEDQAIDIAMDSDWATIEGCHYCEDCWFRRPVEEEADDTDDDAEQTYFPALTHPIKDLVYIHSLGINITCDGDRIAKETKKEKSMNPDDGYTGCRAQMDGDCTWNQCPQLLDGEPKATGRHCPRYNPDDYEA